MKETVFDATAVLAVLNDEPGAEKVAPLLPRAVMSSVNLAEVVSKLADAGIPDETNEAPRSKLRGITELNSEDFSEGEANLVASYGECQVQTGIGQLGITVISFDEPLAFSTGFLRATTSDYGLSLGDRACLALGKHLHRPVLTADRMWSTLKLDVTIQLIR
ncbi:MAG TPA: type II toxin-antitoxin system VapC family toxin [Nitrospira sp.]|nr:type II toxin-antitoxin system VapC family toxin [Nitrospira sp.]